MITIHLFFGEHHASPHGVMIKTVQPNTRMGSDRGNPQSTIIMYCMQNIHTQTTGVCMCALAALRVWRRQVQGFCTVECAVWVAGAWLGLSRGCFSPDGDWVLCLGVWFGVSSQHQWWLLVCGAGGDAGCGAGLVGAPGAPL